MADRGEGPCVLLLHGQPGRHEHLFPVAERLWGDHRTLNVDRPGYGRTTTGPMPFGEQADLFAAYLREHACGPTVVVGHSLGGAVALLMATLHPDVVAGLVLVASVGGDGSIELPDRLLAAPLVGGPLSAASLAIYGILGPLAPRLRPLRALAGNVPVAPTFELLADRRAFLAEQRELIATAEVVQAAASLVGCPTVVLQGDADTLVLPAAGRDLAGRIPGSRYVELAGQGHLIPRDDPLAIADAVRSIELGGADPD